MNDATEFSIVGLAGSAPGDAGLAVPVARLPHSEGTLVLLRPDARISDAPSLHESELEDLIHTGFVTAFSASTTARYGDIALYASPQMLHRLRQASIEPWEPLQPIDLAKSPPGYCATVGARAVIRRLQRRWHDALMGLANAAGRHFLRQIAAGDSPASASVLAEIESLANLAIYCADDAQSRYACYLRIGFATYYAGNVIAWQRLYDQAIKPDLPSVTLQQLQNDITALAQQYRARLELEIVAREDAIKALALQIRANIDRLDAAASDTVRLGQGRYGEDVTEAALSKLVSDAQLSYASRSNVVNLARHLSSEHAARLLVQAFDASLENSPETLNSRAGWLTHLEVVMRLLDELATILEPGVRERYRTCLITCLLRHLTPRLALLSALRLHSADDDRWLEFVDAAFAGGVNSSVIAEAIRETWPSRAQDLLESVQKRHLLHLDAEAPSTCEGLFAALAGEREVR